MQQITVLMIVLFSGAVLANPALDESKAKEFITKTSDFIKEKHYELSSLVFNWKDLDEDSKELTEDKSSDESYASSEYEYSDEEYSIGVQSLDTLSYWATIEKFRAIIEVIDNFTLDAVKFPVDLYKDEKVVIGITQLILVPELMADKDEYFKWIENDFDDYLKEENHCKYNGTEKQCKLKSNNLLRALKTSNDPEEILFYWKEWRDKNVGKIPGLMKRFVDLHKTVGEKFGKSAAYVFFRDYLDENFTNEMEKALTDLEPTLKEFHAYIRHILHEQYGEVVRADGLIPHHLYEQALFQAWKSDSVMSKEFRGVKMPISNKFNYTSEEIVGIARNFMTSLGFPEMPADFINSTEIDVKDDNCDPEFYANHNTTFMKHCKEVNIKRYLQMHGIVAEIYHAFINKDLEYPYIDQFSLESAIGEAVVLSATTPKYLHDVGHKNVSVLSEDEDMNRLFRMGLHTLLNVPQYYVNTKVMADVMKGNVAISEMNQHYWDLMKKYIGVAPPVERSANAYDFPQKFYYLIERNNQASKFFTEIVGYQIYQSMCEKSGEFAQNDRLHPLHTCSFHKSKEAGQTLLHMIRMGGTKAWQQLLAEITGDDTGMKGTAMAEYYRPLFEWLKAKNAEHKSTVGW